MSRSPSGDALLDALAAALRRRVDERRRAQDRLASFAFRETDDGPAADPVVTAWSVHLTRALGAAADPATLELLGRLRAGPLPLDEAASVCRASGDRLAASSWLGDVAADGLVSHELATGHVELTALGEAILDLVDEVARRADLREPAGIGEPHATGANR